jgi:hypothetical protein
VLPDKLKLELQPTNMIEETIRQIEARLNASPNLAPETRAELLGLLAKLRVEAAQLPARERAVPESSGEAAEPESVQEQVEQLRGSVEEFEDSHPKVIQLVNHIANTLAGLGI